ncbi:MAG TPA: HD domain-containing protein [Spirochaetia bacterium]|nr:HD domain-containing protein [Spirochaetia bacterium]
MTWRAELNDFVKRHLDLDIISTHKHKSAMIHEPIHGSHYFFPHELMVLDQPLIQRLRDVGQVDVVPFVFPSANHNRFEHTIGVVAVADKMLKSLQLKHPRLVDEGDIYNVRMAALLHDCGHGAFSHASEQIYKNFPDFKEIAEHLPGSKTMRPHELLSYALVTSEAFMEFIHSVNQACEVSLDPWFIADSIGGLLEGDKAYLGGIINGPLDADKLDYIQRDSYFTGIKMSLDLDRLFYSLRVTDNGDDRVLGIDIGGISALEQIIFSKMMLFNCVYHHHQVRAAGCLIKDAIIAANRHYSVTMLGKFLDLTDSDILNLGRSFFADREQFRSVHFLRRRKLLKRAFVICKDTIAKNSLDDWWQVIKDTQGEQEYGLQCAIRELTGIERVWVDVPSPPSFSEGRKCIVVRPKCNQPLRELFPIDEWTTSFAQNKYKAFVFCEEEFTGVVYEAAMVAIRDAFGVEFNDNVKVMCKID